GGYRPGEISGQGLPTSASVISVALLPGLGVVQLDLPILELLDLDRVRSLLLARLELVILWSLVARVHGRELGAGPVDHSGQSVAGRVSAHQHQRLQLRSSLPAVRCHLALVVDADCRGDEQETVASSV